MKSLFAFLSVSLITSLSFAVTCPNLAGNYSCVGNSKDFDGNVEVRQSTLPNGSTQYELPFVNGASGNPVYTKIADGIARSRKETTHMGEVVTKYQNTCKSATQLIENDMMFALGVRVIVVYSVSKDSKTMTVNETLWQGANVRKTSAVCTKLQ